MFDPRALQPVSALCSDGAEQDFTAGCGPGALVFLLPCPDLQRRLLLQSAHQERCVQKPGRGGLHSGVCRGRGHQLHHGEPLAWMQFCVYFYFIQLIWFRFIITPKMPTLTAFTHRPQYLCPRMSNPHKMMCLLFRSVSE